MQEVDDSNRLAFEILKIVFFTVSYLLITHGLSVNSEVLSKSTGVHSFYNTLFIFAASTWVDYLSDLRFHGEKRYYDAKGIDNKWIPIIGSCFGAIMVIISLYCVCIGDSALIPLALNTYYALVMYIVLKTTVIAILIVDKIIK